MSTAELVLIVAGIALVVLVASHALLLWLASRLVPERAPDEVYRVACEDGWIIELARYKAAPRPAGAPKLPPVIICHGIGANSISLDMAEAVSIPRYLRARGFDCWLLDLRGRGGSARPPSGRGAYDYCFDDHARLDAKAAIELVKKETDSPRVAWVGHSMGGMSVYGYAETYGDESLQAACVIGSPAAWPKPPFLARFAPLAPLHRLPAIYHVLAARLIAPLSGIWTPPVARLIVNPKNIEPKIIRIGLARALANMSMAAIRQFAKWCATNELRSRDGKHLWFRNLARITKPWLAFGGAADYLVPADAVRAGIEMIGSSEKRFILAGCANGFSADYGHIDLCLGPRCGEEIFKTIAEFLEAHPLEAALPVAPMEAAPARVVDAVANT